jgi:hypothetical protein
LLDALPTVMRSASWYVVNITRRRMETIRPGALNRD